MRVFHNSVLIFIPPLGGGRIPKGIGPTSVVRDRLWVGGKTGQDHLAYMPELQTILTYRGDAVWRADDGEGQALALR